MFDLNNKNESSTENIKHLITNQNPWFRSKSIENMNIETHTIIANLKLVDIKKECLLRKTIYKEYTCEAKFVY